jgi:hypothetical protein
MHAGATVRVFVLVMSVCACCVRVRVRVTWVGGPVTRVRMRACACGVRRAFACESWCEFKLCVTGVRGHAGGWAGYAGISNQNQRRCDEAWLTGRPLPIVVSDCATPGLF